jgi:hypothetical protein
MEKGKPLQHKVPQGHDREGADGIDKHAVNIRPADITPKLKGTNPAQMITRPLKSEPQEGIGSDYLKPQAL